MTNGKNSVNDNIDYPKETELSYEINQSQAPQRGGNTLSLPNCKGPNRKWLNNANPTTPN